MLKWFLDVFYAEIYNGNHKEQYSFRNNTEFSREDEKMRTEQQKHILDGTIRVFNRKGLKFTMDDLAKELGMSKKTIYVCYNDKEALFFDMVDYLFDNISSQKQSVIEDESLSTIEKIKKILGVMPESYKDIDFRQLYSLKDKFPSIYNKVEERLETGWDSTIELIETGIKEGVVRPVPVRIVKMMLEASLEQFFQRDVLIQNGLTYNQALNDVVEILVNGIAVR